ncbi:hypothetical protein BGZ65_007433 [Modicella reniformis]|uniref:Uncharacterized protein n=1 Tax=Modicella reniformis TaxID=1440133 RepID=A0A9P6SQE9_9FUNG|nr:hypothetical protein BGZ65_007433 [Modicella reniformis]
MHFTDVDPVNDFIHKYGWSIVFFDENTTNNNTFAAILDDIEIPIGRDCQLECLRFDSSYFTTDESDRLDKIIERSPNFEDLGLYILLVNENNFRMAQTLLHRYWSMLSVIRFNSWSLENWLPQIVSSFTTRNCFPNLVSFDLQSWGSQSLSSSCVPWIAAMVSAPPQATSSTLDSQSLSHDIADTHNAQCESESTIPWRALRKIVLHEIKLQPEEWKTVIEAMDLSKLRHLDLWSSNISHEAFRTLIDRVPDKQDFQGIAQDPQYHGDGTH